MKRFKTHLTEAKTKPVVFTFGRFNPITKGHAKLIDFIVKKSRGGTGMVFTSQSQDSNKNPLGYNQKIKYLKKFFPKATIVKNTSLRTPFEILKWLSDEGYKDVTMVVGGDRVDEFDKQIRKYVKHTDPTKSYDFDNFNVLNAGARKKGESGSDMRQQIKNIKIIKIITLCWVSMLDIFTNLFIKLINPITTNNHCYVFITFIRQPL
jgi:nicotinic acid mononucleotide adenylyltransferase